MRDLSENRSEQVSSIRAPSKGDRNNISMNEQTFYPKSEFSDDKVEALNLQDQEPDMTQG